MFNPISEHLPSKLLLRAAQPTYNLPKEEVIPTSQKEKQVEYRDICNPVVGNVHHRMESGNPEVASAYFQGCWTTDCVPDNRNVPLLAVQSECVT